MQGGGLGQGKSSAWANQTQAGIKSRGDLHPWMEHRFRRNGGRCADLHSHGTSEGSMAGPSPLVILFELQEMGIPPSCLKQKRRE